MQTWCWRPPAFVPCETLPLSDRGFRYGMSVFESIRVDRGTLLFWKDHSDRLLRACADLGLAINPQAVAAAATQLNANALDGFARIYVTAGDGTIADPADHCRVFLFLEQRARPTLRSYEIALPREVHQPLFGGLKTANYWPNIDTIQRALKAGKQEALLFNENAELVSACMANVFLVKDGVLRTPSLVCGARDGVIRDWVMNQLPVKECSLFLDDVRSADELFISNSWIGIMPASIVDCRKMPSTETGEKLRDRLERVILAQSEGQTGL
jgi:branched-subunit amino acid aminotransferase/4-amino-4-deoxychorismate lyase